MLIAYDINKLGGTDDIDKAQEARYKSIVSCGESDQRPATYLLAIITTESPLSHSWRKVI